MSFKEKIENNIAIWILGTLLTGFLAGIATYRGIIGIADLQVVTKSQMEKTKLLDTVFVDTCKSGVNPSYADTVQILKEQISGMKKKNVIKAQSNEATNSPGAYQAGHDININNGTSPPKVEPANLDALIRLREIGDTSFYRARMLADSQINSIDTWLQGWESNVEKEVTKVSKVALNKVRSARRRRNLNVYTNHNNIYDGLMDRLEFQIEALNDIIEGRY